LLDLPAIAAALRAETVPTRNGHRQITIYQHPPVTVVLFAFDPGGQLADHQAGGVVTIHLIAGAVQVQTPVGSYDLAPAMLVALAPAVPHSVTATQESIVLLTVSMSRTD
jgi:quercetin dioxygenase-like cupin family protein